MMDYAIVAVDPNVRYIVTFNDHPWAGSARDVLTFYRKVDAERFIVERQRRDAITNPPM